MLFLYTCVGLQYYVMFDCFDIVQILLRSQKSDGIRLLKIRAGWNMSGM